MRKTIICVGLLGAAALSCSKMSKEQAETTMLAYYANEGRVECQADFEVVPGGDAFGCENYRCRECASALLDKGLIKKTEQRDVYRYLRSAVKINAKDAKLSLYCAKKSGVLASFSSKGDFGHLSVEETLQPDSELESVERPCGVSLPRRERATRSLRVRRDGEGWMVLHEQ